MHVEAYCACNAPDMADALVYRPLAVGLLTGHSGLVKWRLFFTDHNPAGSEAPGQRLDRLKTDRRAVVRRFLLGGSVPVFGVRKRLRGFVIIRRRSAGILNGRREETPTEGKYAIRNALTAHARNKTTIKRGAQHPGLFLRSVSGVLGCYERVGMQTFDGDAQ